MNSPTRVDLARVARTCALSLFSAAASAQGPRADVVPIAPPCGTGVPTTVDLDQSGSTPVLRLAGPPSSFVFLQIGTSDTTAYGVPLPFRLDILGLPGCALYGSAEVLSSALLLGASGAGALPLPAIFADPPVPVFVQGLVLDAGTRGFAASSNAIAIDRGWATEFQDLPQRVMADLAAGTIPWRNLTAADIDRFGRQAHATAASPQELTDWLRTYVAMDDAQLAAGLRAVQREGFAAAGIQYLPELGMTVEQIAAATEAAIVECRRRLGVPLHLAAIRATPGVEDVMNQVFGASAQPPINGCGDVSFPHLYPLSYRLPRFGWSSSVNLRRAGSSDGCFNYRHTFQHDIRGLSPISPAALGMIGAHGLGWRLYGSDRSLYYRGWWATAFGMTFITMQASMQIRKR